MLKLGLGKKGTPRNLLSFYIWCVFFALILGVSYIKRSFFPRKMFFDAGTIEYFMQYADSFANGGYESTAYFFSLIGVGKKTPWFIILSTIMFLYAIYSSFSKLNRTTLNPLNFALITFLALIGIGSVALLSKEFIAFLPTFVFMLLYPLNKKASIVGWFVTLIVYGLFFRSYFLLFAIAFLGMYWAIRKFKSVKWTIFAIVIGLLGIAIVLGIGMGLDISSLRYSMNANRDTASMVPQIISSSALPLAYINIVLTYPMLLFPVPILQHPSPYYVVLFILISWLFFFTGKKAYFYLRWARGYRDPFYEFYLAIVIAFIMVQAFFVPDYGSFMKHLSVIFPFVIITAFRYIPGESKQERKALRGR